jgi:hypothetical protein
MTSLTMGTMVTIPKWNVFHDGLTQPGNDKNTLRTGIDGPVEIVDLPNFIAWWIFPYLCDSLPESPEGMYMLLSYA